MCIEIPSYGFSEFLCGGLANYRSALVARFQDTLVLQHAERLTQPPGPNAHSRAQFVTNGQFIARRKPLGHNIAVQTTDGRLTKAIFRVFFYHDIKYIISKYYVKIK